MRKKTEAEIHIYIDRERTSRSRQRELFEEFDRGDERAEQGIKDMLTALFLIYLFILYIYSYHGLGEYSIQIGCRVRINP